MGKANTKLWLLVGVVIVILGIIGYTFFGKDSSSKIKTVEVEDLSTLMLASSDFPEGQGWTLKDRAERAKSDVSDSGLALGWKRGYYATYLRGDINTENLDYSRVDIFVSEYPLENVTLSMSTQESTNLTTFELLSDPRIGDESKSYKVTDYESDSISYWIEFRKNNFKYTLISYGTRTDYELLKELAKKTENKL